MGQQLTYEQYKKIKHIIPIFDVTAWSGFTNQPANDGVEIGSDSASDTGFITIFGTDYSTGEFTYETVKLTGTTYVSTVKTDWGNVYGCFLGNIQGKNITAAVGTITLREASGNAAITTITAGKISTGIVAFKLPGLNLRVENISGNTWLNTVQVPTVTTGGAQMTSRMYVNLMHPSGQYIYFISDGSASTVQIYVYDD